jgi:cytosol alanyl aminopeptidase
MSRILTLFLACSGFLPALPAPPAFLLPDNVVPLKHTIELTIDPSQDTFDGWARIEVELRAPASVIWVNAKDITATAASVGSQKARATAVGGEFLAIELDSPAPAGRTTISIRYQGKLDDKSVVGPYRRKVDGEWYVFTTFTPIDARRAFPCFDEPRFKTPWEISIRVKRDDKAFANGAEASETLEPNGMKLIRFEPTKPLPAEVVAFCVGPFDVLTGEKAGHGTPIRVITLKGHAAEGKAAAQATVNVLPRLEAYTGIPYPFGKLDHVALPEGAYGAVENPGLITYRAQALLAKPDEDTPEKTRRIRSLEAHEIGHQWFGDMVTQAAWDDVWLSEGFATWFSAKVMDQEQPLARWHLAAIASRERIMATDSSPRTRPVRLTMHSRDDMQARDRGVYSQFVYQKGAAVLLMLEGWLGEDRVRDGLRGYLKQHAFGNASTADLESALKNAAQTDPAAVMDNVLNHTGVPSVHGEVRCDNAGARVVIEPVGGPLPVCLRGDGLSPTCDVVDSEHQSVALVKGASCPAWIYWNAGGTGYYRTAWTDPQLDHLPLDQLTPAERLTLVYDLRASKQTGSSILKKLADDTEPEIATAAGEAIQGK